METIFDGLIRERLSEEVTSELREEWEGTVGGKVIRAEGTANTKVLRLKNRDVFKEQQG